MSGEHRKPEQTVPGRWGLRRLERLGSGVARQLLPATARLPCLIRAPSAATGRWRECAGLQRHGPMRTQRFSAMGSARPLPLPLRHRPRRSHPL